MEKLKNKMVKKKPVDFYLEIIKTLSYNQINNLILMLEENKKMKIGEKELKIEETFKK
jgi:hypothetical protein